MTVLKSSPKIVPAKTVVQNVRSERLVEIASENIITESDRTEMLPKRLPAKTVVQNVRTKKLAERASEKITN